MYERTIIINIQTEGWKLEIIWILQKGEFFLSEGSVLVSTPPNASKWPQCLIVCMQTTDAASNCSCRISAYWLFAVKNRSRVWAVGRWLLRSKVIFARQKRISNFNNNLTLNNLYLLKWIDNFLALITKILKLSLNF